jgi:phage terminase small subunit
MSLPAKRARFCEEYLVDLNATQAAIRAGYNAKSAYSQGQRLLKDVEVAARIEELEKKRSERVGLRADQVLQELAILGMSDVRSFRVDDAGELVLRDGAPERCLASGGQREAPDH